MTSSDNNRKAEEYADRRACRTMRYSSGEVANPVWCDFKNCYLEAYEAGQKNWGWVNINDMTPEVEKWVIIYVPDLGDVRIGMFHGTESDRWVTWRGTEVEVTHWMPLPNPPKELKNELA